MADLNEQTIDQRYVIIELLDEGGMARVYRATDTHLNRTVALKIIPNEKFINKDHLEEILERFKQEARALAQLSHPNIVPILDYGEFEGSPCLVLEYLSGGTLRTKIEAPLPWQVAVKVMLSIMNALTYCHEHSIIHRDIKPSNILFKEDDTPVLADFGIAKLLESVGTPLKTGTGVFVGTAGYMAPEQHNNSTNTKLDARTDVYQMGIVLYEAITGYRPADLANIVETTPHPKNYAPNIPVDLDRILLKALAFKPKDRYQTMEDFKSALQEVLDRHPFPTVTQEYPPTKLKSKPHKRPDDKQSRPLRVYLSYAKADELNVINLGGALRQDGVRIKPDKKNSNPGEDWQERISREIQKSDAVIICLTKNSVGRNSTLQPEIKLALEKAHENSILIIPARLHACKIPKELSTIKYVDLFEARGYLNLRNLLATRAKQIDANPPLTGVVYIPPKIEGEKLKQFKSITVVIRIFLAILLSFSLYYILYYTQFQTSPSTATPYISTAITPAATAQQSSAGPTRGPEITIYPPEITDQRGAVMVPIPSDVFTMGYKAEDLLSECERYSSNCSLHLFLRAEPTLIALEPYYIDKYEVSNGEYQKCVDANVCKPPKQTRSFTRTEYYGIEEFDSYPVIYIDWYMAKTYCEEWRGARLPTEAEWENAARSSEEKLFPWGEGIGGLKVNFCDRNCPVGPANKNFVDGYPDTAPVTALANGASKYGVFNMAGNVWEWISSLYKEYPYDTNDGREENEIDGVIIRVVRGGSWRDDLNLLFPKVRNGYSPTTFNDFIGFRCAKNMP